MATKRLTMRKTKDILRLRWDLGLTYREVARSSGQSVGALHATLARAALAGRDWERAAALDEAVLEAVLYGTPAGPTDQRPLPDFAEVHVERKRKGVTLELLHIEYLERHPGGYRYTQFCELYRQWLSRRCLTMRQVHRAGEKLFVDYSGKKPHLVDRLTGGLVEVELFVGVLGASSYTFAEATATQRSADWIASHIRCFEFVGGAPDLVVPDQLKSGVTRPCRYEPEVQRTYQEMAAHYGTSVLPARPYHPRDKAKVEVAVQVVQRWILARIRNETFFTLEALNLRIAELLAELNDRTMKKFGTSRRALFERLERAALRPLPTERFTYAEWKKAKVNVDYHVEVEHHYYSVPFQLLGEDVEARVGATTVEIFHHGRRVHAHLRSWQRGHHTTVPAHMPSSHRHHLEWSPSRIVGWAATVGPETARLVEAILADRPHPEQGYRSGLGILRLGKRYGNERLERACARALGAGARSYRHVDSILKNGLDQLPLSPAPGEEPAPVQHINIRGHDYYR
jgi:transposase